MYSDIYFQNLTQPNTYKDTLKSIYGCDSLIVIFTLCHYPQVPITQHTASICEGDTYNDDDFTDLTIADTYYITLQNINGCDNVIELTLTVNQNYFTQISDSISTGGSYDFFGKQLTESGIYRDTLQTIHDCDSIFELTLTVTVGIVETQLIASLRIYPNPTNGQLTIDNGKTGFGVSQLIIENVEIYDVFGRKLLSFEFLQSLETTIDVSSLSSGMYFLKIGNQTARFVKE